MYFPTPLQEMSFLACCNATHRKVRFSHEPFVTIQTNAGLALVILQQHPCLVWDGRRGRRKSHLEDANPQRSLGRECRRCCACHKHYVLVLVVEPERAEETK